MKTKRFNSNDVLLLSMLGKTLEEATKLSKSNGFSLRVTREDDNLYIVTQELRPDRINLEIDNEKITSAKIG